MSASTVYIAVAVLALLAVALVLVATGRRRSTPLTPLTALATGLVVAAIAFGENRAVGYTMIALGVALAVADVVRTRGRHGPHSGPGAGGPA